MEKRQVLSETRRGERQTERAVFKKKSMKASSQLPFLPS